MSNTNPTILEKRDEFIRLGEDLAKAWPDGFSHTIKTKTTRRVISISETDTLPDWMPNLLKVALSSVCGVGLMLVDNMIKLSDISLFIFVAGSAYALLSANRAWSGDSD